MGAKFFKMVLVVWVVAGMAMPQCFAEGEAEAAVNPDEEITALKQQVQQLVQRIDKLEKAQQAAKEEASDAKEYAAKAKDEVAKIKETTKAAEAARVDLNNALSKLKMKGRWAAGFYDTGRDGLYPSGSFEVPEAKIQFGFAPDDINNIIMRMSLNNAAFTSVDYFYVDSKLSKALDMPFDLNSRLGRMKLDFGEETWTNNPVESVLASNSAGNVAVSDEGIQLSGKLKALEQPLGWAVSVTNGSTATGSDTSTSKAFTGKLSYNIFDPLYASASYYNSGRMRSATSEMSVAGLQARPTGATTWDREIWEADLRYDFQKGKKTVTPLLSDSKAILRLAYGGFSDSATAGSNRAGDFGFLEGIYNITPKVYSAGRASFVDIDGSDTYSLNSATANEVQRYSLGGGYRWTDNTILKLGYDWNNENGPDVQDVSNNQVSAILTSQF